MATLHTHLLSINISRFTLKGYRTIFGTLPGKTAKITHSSTPISLSQEPATVVGAGVIAAKTGLLVFTEVPFERASCSHKHKGQ